MRGLGRATATLALLALLGPTAGVLHSSAPAGATPVGAEEYDVSIGDSYAAGYQPVASAEAHRDTAGYAYQVVTLARARGYRLVLRNFGCDGATTATVLHQVGCPLPSPGPDAATYPTQTQAGAAEGFLARHRGHIGLVTVSVGGNDILGCASAALFVPCLTQAAPGIGANLHTLVAGLRQAAGPGVLIVGLTYPDVFLGLYTSHVPARRSLALVSVPGFQGVLNPMLAATYAAAGADFVDVTAATGGYRPLVDTTPSPTPQSGRIPLAVAEVCALTYECSEQDVHSTARGYLAIARLVVAQLPDRMPGSRRAG